MEIEKSVKDQYERFPYPKFSWLAKPQRLSGIHATFETGQSLVHGKIESHHGKNIALLGCGTSEALVFGLAHPKANVLACDVSEKTIQQSRLRCKIFGAKVEHHAQDILEFAKIRKNHFDYIHSYGVLHHMADFSAGLNALSEMLKPEGFARLMIYSKTSRRRIQYLRETLKILGISPADKNFEKNTRKFISSLPNENPLRITFETHPESKNTRGLVDAFLHAHERSFLLNELELELKAAGLFIKAWDFSDTLWNLISGAPVIEEKIDYLESFDQWPAPFTFWVSKTNQTEKVLEDYIFLHPLIVQGSVAASQRSFYSGILRKKITLSETHRTLIKNLKNRPYSIRELSKAQKVAIEELHRARWILLGKLTKLENLLI